MSATEKGPLAMKPPAMREIDPDYLVMNTISTVTMRRCDGRPEEGWMPTAPVELETWDPAYQKFTVVDVPGDGNCYFHCVSLAINGTVITKQTSFVRNYVCGAIYSRWDDWHNYVQTFHDDIDPDISRHESRKIYWTKMVGGTGWATTAELFATAEFLNINMRVYAHQTRTTSTGHREERYLPTNYESPCPTAPTVSLLLKHGHFMFLIARPVLPRPASQLETKKAAEFSDRGIQYDHPSEQETEDEKKKRSSRNRKRSNREIESKKKTDDKKKKRADDEDSTADEFRRLGLHYESRVENETECERRSRLRRNKRRLDLRTEFLKSTGIFEEMEERALEKTGDAVMDAAHVTIRDFEIAQLSYKIKSCNVCNEARIDSKVAKAASGSCVRCQSDKHEIPMFSSANNMDPGPVPDALHELSMIEQQLIAMISPCIKIHIKSQGNIGSSGHCVAFPQEVTEPCRVLPKLPAEISVIKFRRENQSGQHQDFRVRRGRVQSALEWLKINNAAYAGVVISTDRLDMLPQDGQLNDVMHLVTEEEQVVTDGEKDMGPAPKQTFVGEGATASGVLLPDPDIDLECRVKEAVRDVLGENAQVEKDKRGNFTIPWPTQGNVPLSEFTTRHFFTMAFPCLFPTAAGDFFSIRKRTCDSLADYAEHLLWYRDGRFARHPYLKFILHNMVLRRQTLRNGRFIVQQKLGDDHYSVEELKRSLASGDDSVIRKILFFSESLRGTSQYWGRRADELKSLHRYQVNKGNGLPSFFMTGSCAEFHWVPLRKLLSQYLAETGQIADLADKNTMFRALQENAHVVAQYFNLRTENYFQTVMRQCFNVSAYWYRVEFAPSRGMIHWHGLTWRPDREPNTMLYDAIQRGIGAKETAKIVADWAQEQLGMTAMHPAGKDEQGLPMKSLWPPPEGNYEFPDLAEDSLQKLLLDMSDSQASLQLDHLQLTNRFNIHRCSKFCQITKKGKQICRMEFGGPESQGKPDRTEAAIVEDRNGNPRLELCRDHPMLVQHSKIHTQAWRANGDVSIIISADNPDNPEPETIDVLDRYVTSYCCKGNVPTGSVTEIAKAMLEARESPEISALSFCQGVLMKTVKRDVGAVEACVELCRIPLYRCSHRFQYLSMSGLRVLDKTGEKITRDCPLDRYLQREKKFDHESWYQFMCRSSDRVPVLCGYALRAAWPLTEDYSRHVLHLHHPGWRRMEDIKPEAVTYVATLTKFLEEESCPNFLISDVKRAQRTSRDGSQSEDDDQLDDSAQPTTENQPEWLSLLCRNIQTTHVDEDVFNYDDGGPEYDWQASGKKYEELGKDFVAKLDLQARVIRFTEVEPESLNNDQRFAYNLVMNTALKYKQNPNNHERLRLIVSGTAGSGKSYLIKCLVQDIRQLYNDAEVVQVVCPTGCAANLINGQTLHSYFKLPTTHRKEMRVPDGTRGEALQKNCKYLKILLVDERSMVGAVNLGWMAFHCRSAMPESDEKDDEWGGLPVVVLFGDDGQLPPVCDTPVYSPHADTPAAIHGKLVWSRFTTAVNLSKSVRQSKDQSIFKEVLESLRRHTVSASQAEWLQQFTWDALLIKYGRERMTLMEQNSLFVFATHEEEKKHNRKKLLEANVKEPVAKIMAVNTGAHASKVPSDKAQGLLRVLYLCKGAKVSLTSNLSTPDGLFNGSPGIVRDLVYLNDRNPPDLPDVVMVEFNYYTGKAFLPEEPKVVPIVAIKRTIDCHCGGCKREMLPLRLSWGTTFHRCQGITTGEGEPNRYIVIKTGTKAFESRNPGALFVALSRAKTVGNNEHLPDFAWHPDACVDDDLLRHVVRTPTVFFRKREVERIQQLCKKTKQLYSNMTTDSFFKSVRHSLSQAEE